MDTDLVRERIRAALKQRKLSMRRASVMSGRSDVWISQFLSGTVHEPGAAGLQNLARVLDVDYGWLVGEKEGPSRTREQSTKSNHQIEFVVAKARSWVERRETEVTVFLSGMALPESRALEGIPRVFFKSTGNHMDASTPPIADGAMLHCAAFDNARMPIRPGMIIVTERTKPDVGRGTIS